MPTYGYKCTKCENQFDVVHSAHAPAVEECPSCGGKVKKVFYPVGIMFKGPGFHVNDYKSGNGADPAASKEPASCPGNPDKPACSSCDLKE
ncbi:MAG: FmdB family zinc ribbon protein [bacterium]|jgi:putative FmdB family regulatory protein